MTQTVPENALGRIAQGDAPVLETLLQMNLDAAERSGLDGETYMLVRLAALVAMDAAPVSYLITLGAAEEAGLTVEKVQAVLVAIAPVVGQRPDHRGRRRHRARRPRCRGAGRPIVPEQRSE